MFRAIRNIVSALNISRNVRPEWIYNAPKSSHPEWMTPVIAAGYESRTETHMRSIPLDLV